MEPFALQRVEGLHNRQFQRSRAFFDGRGGHGGRERVLGLNAGPHEAEFPQRYGGKGACALSSGAGLGSGWVSGLGWI
jgi:hypothetical protein